MKKTVDGRRSEKGASLKLQLSSAVKFEECPDVVGLNVSRGQYVHEERLIRVGERILGYEHLAQLQVMSNANDVRLPLSSGVAGATRKMLQHSSI